MPSNAFRNFRRLAAILLVAALAAMAGAAPSHARETGRARVFRGAGDPAPILSLKSLFSRLFHLFEKAGGGMDPNGLD